MLVAVWFYICIINTIHTKLCLRSYLFCFSYCACTSEIGIGAEVFSRRSRSTPTSTYSPRTCTSTKRSNRRSASTSVCSCLTAPCSLSAVPPYPCSRSPVVWLLRDKLLFVSMEIKSFRKLSSCKSTGGTRETRYNCSSRCWWRWNRNLLVTLCWSGASRISTWAAGSTASSLSIRWAIQIYLQNTDKALIRWVVRHEARSSAAAMVAEIAEPAFWGLSTHYLWRQG